MDIFYEQMLKKEKRTSDRLKITGGLILSIILTAIIILLFLMGQSLFGFNFFLIFCIWWLFVKFLGTYNVEYEYTITNHELDIDTINGKNHRKHITTINLKQIDYFGNKNDIKTKDAMKTSGQPAKEYYFVSSKESKNIYVTDVISRKNGSKVRVYIEPDEDLKEYIRLANPKAFII